ncbi:hypothetical protein JCM19238_4882 [Vibrio ponticus]|nr:hypothetical protein JCM19238_4882 [Vibrio ponticus]
MRKLKIETFAYTTGEPIDSIAIPTSWAKNLAKLLPSNVLSRFDENGEQLSALLEAISDPNFHGTIVDISDAKDNERVVISVLD